jgi:hypothetical protein
MDPNLDIVLFEAIVFELRERKRKENENEKEIIIITYLLVENSNKINE